jgi:hypothetical protein
MTGSSGGTVEILRLFFISSIPEWEVAKADGLAIEDVTMTGIFENE